MPRTILILSSTPRDMAPLRVHEEVREIEDAIRRAQLRDEYQVVVRLGIRARDVHRVLLEHRPAIVHFSGHGRGEQGVVLEDDDGDSLLVDGADLARMLGHFRHEIECVLLNSCQSEAQIEDIAAHIPFVIGMKPALDDRAAIAFAVAFYECLGNGKSIPAAYDVACSAAILDGSALDRVAMLAGKPHDVIGKPLRPTRSWWLAAAAGLAAAGVVAVAFAVSWQRPAEPMSALPAAGGVVVTGELDGSDRDAWQHLCTALRDLGEQAVRCVAPAAWEDDELVAAARAAGASLVIRVEAGPVARVLPVPGRDGEPLLRGLPAVSIARPETRTALAQIAYVLAHGPRDAPSGVAARLPIESDRSIPWRVTALAALARVWTQAAWDSREKAELSGIARRCREEPASLADAHCALIHYVLYAELAPEDADAGPELDALVARGPRGIAGAAALFLLRRRCLEDPARTRRELLELAKRVDDCQRWYLMTPATCVLAASGGKGADGGDDAAIRALAEPGERTGDTCPDDVRAGAHYDRAHWLAETWNASTREEWEQAVESYDLAFRLDPRADHAQALAEALLFLRRHVPGRADELARRAVAVLERAAVQEPTAVFLAWLAGDATDVASLARLCAIYRALPPGEIAVPYVSRRLACPGGEGDDSLSCRAYRVLSAPRLSAGAENLEDALEALEHGICKGNGMAASHEIGR
jgi:tetratricopeptide (TPR) repeat protein